MEQNFYFEMFARIFATNSTKTLVRNFNVQVDNRQSCKLRTAFDTALINELVRRRIDISEVYDGTAIDFSHPVTLDEPHNKLIQAI